jgi:endonuclease/exonuclease/phosphatase (EEP) superfamily protein YafD
MKKAENILIWLAPIIAIILVLAPENFFIMLAKAFAYQYMIALVFLVMWFMMRGRYRYMFVALASVLLVNTLFNEVITGEISNPQANGIKVAHFNVLKYTSNHGPTMERAIETDADIISFQEVDHEWADTLLNNLTGRYPYYKIVPHEGSYGLAIFAKHPLENVQVMYTNKVPNLVGEVVVDKQRINFVASHTKAPLGLFNYRHRNSHIAAISHYLKRIEGPVLVIGDFNTVPWDDHLLQFKSDSNLFDSRKNLAATYPNNLSIARIPIDYIFHSREVECLSFSTITGTSSDHFGIVGIYQVNKNARL